MANPCCKFKNIPKFFGGMTPGAEALAAGPCKDCDASALAVYSLGLKLLTMYNAFDGVTGAAERKIVKKTLQSLTIEERCYICRRPSEFKDNSSFMSYVQGDIVAGFDDLEMAKYFIDYLKCNEFGRTTFTPKPDNEDNALNKGQGPIIKYKQNAGGPPKSLIDSTNIDCAPPPELESESEPKKKAINVDSADAHYVTYTRFLDLILYETVKGYLV